MTGKKTAKPSASAGQRKARRAARPRGEKRRRKNPAIRGERPRGCVSPSPDPPCSATDMFLRMQAFNLSITDPFMAALESDALRKLIDEEHTPVPEASFLAAQSQMRIFAA